MAEKIKSHVGLESGLTGFKDFQDKGTMIIRNFRILGILVFCMFTTVLAQDFSDCRATYSLDGKLHIPCVNVPELGENHQFEVNMEQLSLTEEPLQFIINNITSIEKENNYVLVDELVSVYDGDTFKINITGWPPILSEISIRLRGVDTPEINGKCPFEKNKAQQAKQFTSKQLHDAKNIELHNLKRDKYFRIAADVLVDGKNLAKLIIENNYGRFYTGNEKRGSWCEN
ncbi:thermonuclease family protein [Thiotrichales bacterium HSG1]|nr:thermonuclease family protein [Thiotrichales bacterium HSG1]